LDLNDLDSVRDFSKRMGELYPKVDVLINNAGLFEKEKKTTKQGFEGHFGINYLAHFYLTNLMTPYLAAAPSGGRVISVSSMIHYKGRANLDDLNYEEQKWDSDQSYYDSKLQ